MSLRSSPLLKSVARYLTGWRVAGILSILLASVLVGLATTGGSWRAATGIGVIVLLIFLGIIPLLAAEANRVTLWSRRQAEIAELAKVSKRQSRLLDTIVGGATRS